MIGTRVGKRERERWLFWGFYKVVREDLEGVLS
jgi:hypothetical protein